MPMNVTIGNETNTVLEGGAKPHLTKVNLQFNITRAIKLH